MTNDCCELTARTRGRDLMAILYPLCRLFFFFFLPQVSSSSSSSSSWPLVTSTINNSEDVTSEPATRHRRNAHSGTSSYLLSKIWCREKKKTAIGFARFDRHKRTIDTRSPLGNWPLRVVAIASVVHFIRDGLDGYGTLRKRDTLKMKEGRHTKRRGGHSSCWLTSEF